MIWKLFMEIGVLKIMGDDEIFSKIGICDNLEVLKCLYY